MAVGRLACGMEKKLTWKIAFEVLAAVPFTLGIQPRDSVVLSTVRLDGKVLTMGPRARLDFADVEQAYETDGGHTFKPILDRMANACPWGALVGVWLDVHDEIEVVEALEKVHSVMMKNWNFARHLGCYLINSREIHGYTADGIPMGAADILELGITHFAMHQEACELPQTEEELKFKRDAEGPEALEVAQIRKALEEAVWSPLDPRRDTALMKAVFKAGGVSGPEEAARLGHAMEDLQFRDGFIAWVLADRPKASDFTLVPAMSWLNRSESHGPAASIGVAIPVLASIARYQPPGMAGQVMACGAYLAWYGGLAVLPRVITAQALQEDPDNRLSNLVAHTVAEAVPPPWFREFPNAA